MIYNNIQIIYKYKQYIKMSKLIIVESYTKTKTIAKYLDDNYKVICSLGHICNLPKKSLGINTTLWTGVYEPLNNKIINNIRSSVKECDEIYIASDPDTEGEAIAHHIKMYIMDLLKNKKCYRIKFYEITKTAILNAINNPMDIDANLVEAQETRRFLDRLVGYSISPLLWKKLGDNKLSAGRVQSVALYMVINQLNKIIKHVIEPYWIILGIFKDINNKELEFKLYTNNDILKITDEKILKETIDIFSLNTKYDINIKETFTSENPSAPYTTTTLQQDAYNKFKYNSKKTMKIAQELYENGLITYMRTDSTNIADDFKKILISYINKNYETGLSRFRTYKNKITNAQEAHEAIRITNPTLINISSLIPLTTEHQKLYEMIYNRTLSSQMINAEYTNIEISLKYKDYCFINKKSLLTKKGYLYNTELEDVEIYKNTLKKLTALEYRSEGSINTIPSLYNEIGLIKALEKEGVGRPSTYSSIIEKLFDKNYIEKGKNPQQTIEFKNIIKKEKIIYENSNINIGGKNKDLLIPTELGISVFEYLQSIIPFLLDIKFTAKMEDNLDKIADKQYTKNELLNEFYNNHLEPIIKSQEHISQEPSNKNPIIKTKYGWCYYANKKYTNIDSYLKWRNIKATQIKEIDINFFKSLPIKTNEGEVHLGQYGIYLKDKNGKNVRIDKNLWINYL